MSQIISIGDTFRQRSSLLHNALQNGDLLFVTHVFCTIQTNHKTLNVLFDGAREPGQLSLPFSSLNAKLNQPSSGSSYIFTVTLGHKVNKCITQIVELFLV